MTGVAGLWSNMVRVSGVGTAGAWAQSLGPQPWADMGRCPQGPGRLSGLLWLCVTVPCGWYSSLGNGDKAGMGMGPRSGTRLSAAHHD